MRSYKESVTMVKQVEKLQESVTCNNCGVSDQLTGNEDDRFFQANKYQTLNCSFGYGSMHDGEDWSFDLCDECLNKLVRTFKYMPDGYGVF